MGLLLALALLSGIQDAPADVQGTATKLANATTYDLTFRNDRVTDCRVTATSGYAEVDRYVCDAARQCGDQNSKEDRRAACVAKKREELADLIVKKLNRTK